MMRNSTLSLSLLPFGVAVVLQERRRRGVHGTGAIAAVIAAGDVGPDQVIRSVILITGDGLLLMISIHI